LHVPRRARLTVPPKSTGLADGTRNQFARLASPAELNDRLVLDLIDAVNHRRHQAQRLLSGCQESARLRLIDAIVDF
jgi:hypothetical protein